MINESNRPARTPTHPSHSKKLWRGGGRGLLCCARNDSFINDVISIYYQSANQNSLMKFFSLLRIECLLVLVSISCAESSFIFFRNS